MVVSPWSFQVSILSNYIMSPQGYRALHANNENERRGRSGDRGLLIGKVGGKVGM